ncbi:hypothetical protein PQU92_15100 [Asticcacaulis sp. BYS171W]|uniref:Glucosamine inositolphosphorylceramide transferase 1 N-terminal domain-containing protein n=1 Tax=Asticcacaulis aquaticus TaxID=2984212 RepID=A0ABT5HX07_9CAUL|nr:hypothetical protein [Asticcacaulis aquaticus]
MIDLWHVGFIDRSIEDVSTDAPKADEIVWLPLMGSFRFIADPFGLRRDDVLTIFAEAYDYRVKRGEIHYYQYDAERNLIGRGEALVTPFHLSYPYLIEDGGELYMLPEAHKSGVLTLYRCTRFPDRWAPVKTLLDIPAIDATVVKHDGQWWMFYALPGAEGKAMRELYIAHADDLMGPWTSHAANPVRTGFETSRPGGDPFVKDGALHLPMQDCVGTYGAAINLLRVDTLTPETFSATEVGRLTAEGLLEGYREGFHTLSGRDSVTFIDVKQIHKSAAEPFIKLQFKLRKALGMNKPG